MKGNVSSYICNHGSPSGERDTASPRLCALLRMQASDEELDDVFSRRPLYCGRVGIDVIGCRRPTAGVFIYMYASSTGHADGVPPIATPRGRSVSFPTRGNHGYIRNLRRFWWGVCLNDASMHTPTRVESERVSKIIWITFSAINNIYSALHLTQTYWILPERTAIATHRNLDYFC